MSSLIYAGTSSVVAGGFGNGASGHEEERGHAVNENAKGRDPDDRRAGNRRRRLEPAQCLSAIAPTAIRASECAKRPNTTCAMPNAKLSAVPIAKAAPKF